MPFGRGKLPVLAEIGGPGTSDGGAWSLVRADLEALSGLERGLDGRRTVAVSGEERLAAALALAAAARARGRRTVLVECDLARPRLAAEVGLAPAPGLHEYLRWEATAPQILQPLLLAGPASRRADEPLVCVVAGREEAEPETLLGLDSFRHAIAKLRTAYELVVLLAPPPDTASGPLEEVGAQADAVLAAVPPKGLAGRSGRLLRTQLGRLGTEVRGAIVVGAPGSSAQRS
jgi:Mrp family chromosome partitioning ATPase